MQFPNIYLLDDDGVLRCYQRNMSEKQKAFHNDPSKFRALLGGVGGGKSVAALVEVLKHSWMYKDNYGFILRETLPDLKLSAYKDFYAVCPHWMIYEENKQERWIDVLNHIGYEFLKKGGLNLPARKQQKAIRALKGLSRIEFISFEGTERGEKKFRSANIGWYFIEQAESAYLKIYDNLNERMRRPATGRKGIFVGNPDGHNWLWRIFHPDSPDKRKGHAYFPIKLQDNPMLPDDYHETLKDTYDKETYEKMVLGSHEIATGAVYPELSNSIHLIDHVDPPDEWVKGIGLDHGLNNPTAFLLGAKFPKPYEGIYIYHEYQVADEIVSFHINQMKPLLTPKFECFAIDPETKKHDAVNFDTVLGEYKAYGIPFRPSSRDRVAGVNRIKEYLKWDDSIRNPWTDALGSPRIFISKRCPMLIDALRRYKREEAKTSRGTQDPPEKFSDYNVHLPDALRYLIMRFTRPLSARSTSKGFDREHLQGSYRTGAKRNELLDENNDYSLAKLIEQSHRVGNTQHTGATTWV